jgi:hypothetical protein
MRCRHQAVAGHADYCAQDRRGSFRDVEKRGGIRPRTSIQPTAAHVGSNARRPDQAGAGDHHVSSQRQRFKGKHPPSPWSPTSDGESQTLGYAPLEYQTKPWPKEALPDGWCPFSCGAHVLFNIVANGIAECFARSRLLDGNRQIENSLPRSGIAVFVHTRDMAARCRNLGGAEWFVLDISFSRRTGFR